MGNKSNFTKRQNKIAPLARELAKRNESVHPKVKHWDNQRDLAGSGMPRATSCVHPRAQWEGLKKPNPSRFVTQLLYRSNVPLRGRIERR